ncbi:hypothetical protein K1719_019748 [Acacia pycnantha]|nr:hypothetical protein K1719_019748 [Acacia pycnantha]
MFGNLERFKYCQCRSQSLHTLPSLPSQNLSLFFFCPFSFDATLAFWLSSSGSSFAATPTLSCSCDIATFFSGREMKGTG